MPLYTHGPLVSSPILFTYTQPIIISYGHICYMESGAREQGGGQRGQFPPPNFLSQWDEYACAPPPLNFGNH